MGKFALYVHFPFCHKKCLYCDFYSITDLSLQKLYIKSLCREIDSVADYLQEKQITSVYFGGGTPSSFLPKDLGKVLELIFKRFSVQKNAEITCETNPATVKQFDELRGLDFNRLTIGVQSLIDTELRLLGRIHDARQAISAIENARKVGFTNLAIDLIYAIPNQTINSLRESLDLMVKIAPQHISFYGLTVESGTPLAAMVNRGTVKVVDDEIQREMALLGMQTLTKNGFQHYEISNYAQKGFFAIHNQVYWSGKPYLGLGASAHSFDGNKRWSNFSDVEKYCHFLERGKAVSQQVEVLNREEKMLEFIMLGLRQSRGLDLHRWQTDFSTEFDDFFAPILKNLGVGDSPPFMPGEYNNLLTRKDERLSLTREGVLLYDSICQELAALV